MGSIWHATGMILFERTDDLSHEKPMKIGDLKGRPWSWRDLRERHPDLWDRYFVKRDRRRTFPSDAEIKDEGLLVLAYSPLGWVDFYEDPEYLLAQYATLSPDQVGLHATFCCHFECMNGGMDQFFCNSTGAVAVEALEGFKRFGADAHYEDLARIVKAFPLGGPSRDRETRRAQKSALWGEGMIDDAFKDPDGLPDYEPILEQYIRTHPKAFFRNA